MVANIIIGLLGLTCGFFCGLFAETYALRVAAKKYKEETGNDFIMFIQTYNEQEK